jgi:hypothetical protein
LPWRDGQLLRTRAQVVRSSYENVGTASRKCAQADRLMTSTGPSGFLLSRTGTTPGIPGATSMQSPPLSPLWLLLIQVAALSS